MNKPNDNNNNDLVFLMNLRICKDEKILSHTNVLRGENYLLTCSST